MSTIANLPKVKEALDNLREVLETERRDRIEWLRSCIRSWKEEIARAEKLPEQIAKSEAEIAELETVSLPLSVTTLLGGAARNWRAVAREAEIAEQLAAILENVNLACFGVDDLLERLERTARCQSESAGGRRQ